ncbi:MAG: hypothetical protein LBQ64_05050 [Bacteroidales bacterium]|nr:hypothetical protein [Bacteroidales bacterium]
MNVLRTIGLIKAVLFPRQGIHINRKSDISPNHIVRRTFTCDDLSKGKSIPRHPPFFPDDPAAGWGLTMT